MTEIVSPKQAEAERIRDAIVEGAAPERTVAASIRPLLGGLQVLAVDAASKTAFSVICHRGSYGYPNLWEAWGGEDDPTGYLTVDEVIEMAKGEGWA